MSFIMKINVDFIYPIGSIYMSVNSTNPGTLFGGTWTQLKDRFLLGAGNTYSNGATGGEATHKLTGEEMPNHRHYGFLLDGYNVGLLNGTSSGIAIDFQWNKIGSTFYTNTAGGDQPHNNMPPYLVVYMWKRTA